MNKYFDDLYKGVDDNVRLDDEQREAILCDGNSIIIAGAGSGKTTTMAAKVKYLIDSGISYSDIVVISYTNKAVSELRERINDGFHIPCLICTFHKFALNILKSRGFKYNILSDNYDVVYEYICNKYDKKKNVKELVIYYCDFLKRFKNMGYDDKKTDE